MKDSIPPIPAPEDALAAPSQQEDPSLLQTEDLPPATVDDLEPVGNQEQQKASDSLITHVDPISKPGVLADMFDDSAIPHILRPWWPTLKWLGPVLLACIIFLIWAKIEKRSRVHQFQALASEQAKLVETLLYLSKDDKFAATILLKEIMQRHPDDAKLKAIQEELSKPESKNNKASSTFKTSNVMTYPAPAATATPRPSTKKSSSKKSKRGRR